MSMINIDELNRINTTREKNKLDIYEKVLKKCHERIKTISKKPKNNQFCFYVVPNILYGIPLYDVNMCILYLVNSLSKNGFYVSYTHPNLIFISWYNRTNSIEYKKVKNDDKKQEEKYKAIDSAKPKNDFLYDISSLDFLNDKKDNLLNM